MFFKLTTKTKAYKASNEQIITVFSSNLDFFYIGRFQHEKWRHKHRTLTSFTFLQCALSDIREQNGRNFHNAVYKMSTEQLLNRLKQTTNGQQVIN